MMDSEYGSRIQILGEVEANFGKIKQETLARRESAWA
jgi:hypothetical protein